jgi:antitoxin (DNA-binding transcriptional repressor) of toxin-antitoxin stability system
VIIAYRGEEVAEIRPVDAPAEDLAARLDEMRRKGLLTPSTRGKARLRTLARRPGALQRFLRSRD